MRCGGLIRLLGGVASGLLAALFAATAVAQTAQGQSAAKQTAPPAAVTAHDITVSSDANGTLFTIEFSGLTEPAVYVLADPPRLVIDIANVAFKFPPGAGKTSAGLIAGYRFGLVGPGRSRVVIDVTGPVAVARAEMLRRAGGRAALAVTITETEESAFRAAAAAGLAAPGQPTAKKAPVAASPPAGGKAAQARHRPLIVIDPGHGGLDPGAVGGNGVLEKDIVLAVSRQLRTILANRQRYDLVMTRANDVFVPLDQRVSISEGAAADLFISIHADSLEATEVANTVRGATVYTLSDKASDEQARRLAERENAADLLAGLGAASREQADPVRDILFELLGRETANFSADLRSIMVSELGKSIALSRDPSRSAAFRVLRQTQTPSVLIELGYMSNTQDQALMTTPSWQRNVAAAIADAVDLFFARRGSQGGG